MTRPAFIVSLPRSGSTLLQKMLAVSPNVASSAEPWILLPFWGMRNPGAGRNVYFHHTAANAINDFVGNIAVGEHAYAQAVGEFGRRIYTAAAAGRSVFLDKTPRYYLMLPLLRAAFPEARIVVLVRHPLAVLASIGQTFYRGRFMWLDYQLDWIEGHQLLAAALREPWPGLMVVRYEELVKTPEAVLPEVCQHIGIDFSEEMMTGYRKVDLPGRMGDPVGVRKYGAVSAQSVEKWHEFFDSPFRRRAAVRMLSQIQEDDLRVLGFSVAQIQSELLSNPPKAHFDLPARLDRFIDEWAYRLDYRYIQARWRAYKKGDRYAYGYRC